MKKNSNISRWWISIFSIMLIIVQNPVPAQSGINEFGSFEQDLPSYWTKGAEPSGATLSWAKDDSHSMGRSLKITKATTSEVAMWE
ncbi:MAG: hypothetical protein M0P61_17900, partial [Ignavibacteriaceae bacterium]|nr:hypothetical protein [Ignavibacteriaceae bacterium]